MASKLVAFVCIQSVLFNVVFSQCVNRIVPNCGCSNLETILPNQQILYNNLLANQLGFDFLPNQVVVNPSLSNQVVVNPSLPNQVVVNPSLPNQVVVNPSLPNQVVVNPSLPNQLFVNPSLPNQYYVNPSMPNQYYVNQPCGVEVLPQSVPTTTIIQDSTVANNLANALQLLVVSNLLSNTLPLGNDVVLPYGQPVEIVAPYGATPYGGCGLGNYNYLI